MVCTKCEKDKEADAFYRYHKGAKKGRLRTVCKACTNEQSSKYYEANKDWLAKVRDTPEKREYCKLYNKKHRERLSKRQTELRKLNPEATVANREAQRKVLRAHIFRAKSAPCMDCGQSFPPVCMEFDHNDRNEKKYAIGNVASSGTISVDTLHKEIKKCDLVCANCHRVRNMQKLNWGAQYQEAVDFVLLTEPDFMQQSGPGTETPSEPHSQGQPETLP